MNRVLVVLMALILVKPVTADPMKIAAREDFLLSELYVDILTEAYQGAEISVEFAFFPGGSSLNLSNSQKLGIQGETGRSAGVLGKYENLIKVDTPIYTSHLSVFTQDATFEVDGWDSLEGKNIITRLGFKEVVDQLNQRGIEYRAVDSTEQAMRMLSKGYADAVVLNRVDGLITLSRLNIDNIVLLDVSLAELPIFHMLHKSNEMAISRINDELEKMSREGRIKELTDEFLKRYSLNIEGEN